MDCRSPIHILAETADAGNVYSPSSHLNFNREVVSPAFPRTFNPVCSPQASSGSTRAMDAIKASPRMELLMQVAESSDKQKKKRQPPNPEKKSSYRGVSWQKTSKAWVAQYKTAGKTTYLGLFQTEEEAARA